jgi:hypothetical protein
MGDVVVAGLRWWRNLRIAVCRRPKTCRSHDLSSISRCDCFVPQPLYVRLSGVVACWRSLSLWACHFCATRGSHRLKSQLSPARRYNLV